MNFFEIVSKTYQMKKYLIKILTAQRSIFELNSAVKHLI